MAGLAGQGGRKMTPPPPLTPTHERIFSQVPVTALAFNVDDTGDLLLVGEHADVLIYEGEPLRLLSRQRVFDDQPIQGIRASAGQAIFWGSSYVAVAVLKGSQDEKSLEIERCSAPDWVFDAIVSPFDPDVFVLATAHNEVIVMRRDREGDSLVLGRVIAPARPGLYSAQLAWLSPDCVLMVAGTAFGEILVWKCFLDRRGSDAHEMLYVLTGHEGSIYGVDISEPVLLADGKIGRLMATCSDDRTVRIWDIAEREDSAKGPYHDFNAPRETGFSASLPGESRPSLESKPPIAVAMGHLSRIWGVKMAISRGGKVDEEGISVYTFGEDSTTQKWHLSISSGASLPLKGSLEHKQTFSLHEGKHLWSNVILCKADKNVIATGGADSKVSIVEESVGDGKPSSTTMTLDIPDIYPTLMETTKGPEIVNRFDLISENELLIVTSAGRLSVGSLRSRQWKHVAVSEHLEAEMKKCYVLKRAAPGTAFLGLTTGDVFFYSQLKGTISHVSRLCRKIVDITCLNYNDRSMNILVQMFGTASPQFFRLDIDSGAILEEVPVTGVDSRFVSVSAALVQDFLILGSRHGWISVLRRGDEGYERVLDVPPRTGDSITSITPLPSKASSSMYLLTTHRDGRFRISELDDTSLSVKLHLRHESSPPFGPMIEGAWFTDDETPELILYGFRSKSFIVWNESRREECANVDCGGAHRTFTFWHHSSVSASMRFAFTRVSKLAVYMQDSPVTKTVKPGTHGREIRSLSANERYLATGSEDTTVRIWEPRTLSNGQTELQPVAVLKSHVTGLQALKWLGEDYLFSSSGMEDFFIWRIRVLDANYKGLAVVREGVFDDRSADGDLRIMDFDVHRLGDVLMISMVFSNSTIRTYRYTADMGFQIFAKGIYTGACLTQIRHLGIPGEDMTILTASTDGHIVIWSVFKNEQGDLTFALAQATALHQSSIKALDMIVVPSGEAYVLTAGDDNALGLTVLSPDPDFRISSRGVVRNAHAAAVNGVVLTREDDTTVLCTSVSNDQRIKTWRIRPEEARRIEKVAEDRSGVADPSDVGLLGRDVIVGGVGLEIWRRC